MQHFEENETKISDYFDSKMNALEEEAFMQQLGVNTALRQQYENELMIRGLFSTDKDALKDNDLPGDEMGSINFQETAIKKEENPSAQKFFFLGRFRNIAAAILAIISIAFVFKLVINKNITIPAAEENIAKVAPEKNDSIAKIDSSKIIARPVFAENIFKKYYIPYTGEKDPVEISNYYNSYKKGEYKAVISARESDYQTMGVNRKDILKQYMNLYRGLSYLGQNKPANAIATFDLLLQPGAKKSGLYYEAQWYKALAWLKKDDFAKTTETLALIMQSASPYKNKATELSNEMVSQNPLSK